MITQVVDGIQWVGVVDWGLKHFHGFELSTQRGTTYNAYIVQDQKTALVDSVWSPFTGQFLQNVREVVDPLRRWLGREIGQKVIAESQA
jgi:anaerobic nitric oxide reductase flavorubredoxin